jgi:hypothetical protein
VGQIGSLAADHHLAPRLVNDQHAPP